MSDPKGLTEHVECSSIVGGFSGYSVSQLTINPSVEA